MTGPLAGIRVLDLGTRIGAPFAATLLADLGAEVIKVELPGQGDFMRSIGPFVDGYSLFWAVEGRGKKSVTCDLRKPAGQALLKRLVPLADVVMKKPSRCAWHGPREVTQGAPGSRPSWSTRPPARGPSAIRPWTEALLMPANAGDCSASGTRSGASATAS